MFGSLRLTCRLPLSGLRLYSTQPAVSPAAVSEAVKYLKRPDSRKTFLINRYKMLFEKSEIVLFVHHNNLVKSETNAFRAEIKALGGELSIVRNRLLLSYLRAENEAEPASIEAYKRTKGIEHPFAPLLVGPTAIITIQKTDPSTVKKLVKFTKSTNEKLFLIGARIDNKLFNLTEIEQFKELSTIEQLQSQLAGLLTVMSGAGLVQTLQSASQHLYLTLDSHRQNNDPSTKKEQEEETK